MKNERASVVHLLSIEYSANVSDCGRYRYGLERRWDRGANMLPIIMLNPSTADASVDDPTIRRCMAFARRDGFGGIAVANLFAFRATSPAEMMTADDPIGPEGSDAIEQLLSTAASVDVPVLAAWGAHGSYRGRDEAVMLSAKGHGARLVCLGTTKDGHPRHPLYVPSHHPFIPLPHPTNTRRA
jgi:hypothetical protein